nr:ribonuclease H-like domain-containing protein [Tanacetum cinerariifolium]
DDYVEDRVTLISKLDISDHMHFNHNDSTALTVVSIKLKATENYQVWSCAMLLALKGKNTTGFIDGSCKRSNTDEVLGRQWDMVNTIVLGWILNSIFEELFLDINHINFFDGEYPEIVNDDERVDPNLNSDNKSQSDSSHSYVSGGDVNTVDFPDNSGNDADSSEDIFATHNEKAKCEAEKERRIWDNVQSRRSPTNNDKMDVDSFHQNK